MATAVIEGVSNYPVMNSEVRLGEDTLAPGLADDLQQFYEKTCDQKDREKCLELIASIRTGESNKYPKRPYTAIPSSGTDHQKNFNSPYQTSYNRDYPIKQPIDTVALRPMTSHGFPPQQGPAPETHYDNQFPTKQTRPITPLRPGTSSGNRANNPHPLKSFLVWKFPRRGPKETEGAKWSEELTDDKINQVHKRLCQSTYQRDFMGTPQGFQLKSAYSNLPPDWKENIPYTLDSVQRYSYLSHQQPDDLQLPNTRYGSNRKKQIPASGTIPTASNRHMHIRNRTTYDRHYNDNADAVTGQIRETGHKLGAEALRKYYETAKQEEDRVMARRLLDAYQGRRMSPGPQATPQGPAPIPPSYSARPLSRSRTMTPASTPLSTPYVPEAPVGNPRSSQLSFNVCTVPELIR